MFVAVSDYMKIVPDQIAPWVPGGLMTLGTDGFGRSDTRANLRRFFEVDAELTALATLYALHQKEAFPAQVVEARDPKASASIRKNHSRSIDKQSKTQQQRIFSMDVKLPQLAEGVEGGTVVSILVTEGQAIKKDQPFMELETQKAVGSIPAPSAGVVTKIHVKQGMEVNVGQTLISIEAAASETPAAAPAEQAAPSAAANPNKPPTPTGEQSSSRSSSAKCRAS